MKLRRPLVIGVFIFVCCLVLMPQVIQAQPGREDPVPITGIEWLLMAGGLWGAKKVYEARRRK